MSELDRLLPIATCPECNKKFIVPSMNIYKRLINRKVVHYCSYTCYRVLEIENEKKHKL